MQRRARTGRTTPNRRHSPFRPTLPGPTPADLLHTFELATALDAHAVSRAARASARDLTAARAAADDLVRRSSAWAALELRFHRALNDQGGNPVLAALAERTLQEGLTACPILSREELSVLQSHHLEILRCVEAGQPEAAARHTRAHLLSLRDVLLSALQGSERPRLRLPT